MTYPFRGVVRTSFSTGHWLIACTVNCVLYTLEQKTPSEKKKTTKKLVTYSVLS